MALRIFTYPISTRINIPKGAEILHVGKQGCTPCLWAKVDPAARKVERRIHIVMTGQDMNTSGNLPYIGTNNLSDHYVEHYFDGGES